MRFGSRCLFGIGAMVVVAWGASGVHATPEAQCGPAPCDVTAGTGCSDAYEPAETIFPLEVESIERVTRRVAQCSGPWHGDGGCYAREIRKDLSDLGLVADEIDQVDARGTALPDPARTACDRVRPELATRAIDEVETWCRVGQGECAGALDLARVVLRGMDRWHSCVERMEARLAENARHDARACATSVPTPSPTPAPTVVAPVAPTVAAPTAAPPSDQTMAPKREPTVVEAKPLRVVEAQPLASYGPRPAPPTAVAASPTVPRAHVDAGPTQGTIAQLEPPKVTAERRTGQFELSLAPFSGVLTIRDPIIGADYSPLAAGVAVGLNVVADVADGIDLEFALAGRGTFASSALQQAATVGLDELATESGTALVLHVEPSVTVLSRYVGVGVVADFRWDSIGVTSLTSGLVRHDNSAVMGGARFIVGLGLLATDLRLLGMLDYLFLGGDEATLRASIRAELGPALIVGSYTDYARLGGPTDAYAVDNLQLTLGFRMVF